MAARALREEPQAAARAARRPGRRALLRRPRARPARARDDVDAGAAADDEHDGADGVACRAGLADRRVLRRPGPPVHAAGLQRPSYGLALAPARDPRLAARARHVGGRGAHPPVPDQGAGRAAADLPAVLRPLHAHGPRRQLDAGHREAQVRRQAERPARVDDGLPAPHAAGARRRRLRRRRGQHAVGPPRGVADRAARDREHPRHPARHQGADGSPPALAAGRRGRGHVAGVRRSRGRVACPSRSTPTSTTPTP